MTFSLLKCFILNILVGFAQASTSRTIKFVDACPLKKDVKVQWDPNSRQFKEIDTNSLIDGTPKRRNLRAREITELRLSDDIGNTSYKLSPAHSSANKRQTSTGNDVYTAKECECAGNYGRPKTYCLIEHGENTCSIPENSSDSVLCYLSTPSDTFVHNAWPISLLWLGAIFVYATITEGGRMGLKYACRCCCKKFDSSNENLVDEILRREAAARRSFQIIAMRHYETQRERSPVTYILKTKEFVSEKKEPSLHSPSSPSDLTAPISPSSDSCLDQDQNDLDMEEENTNVDSNKGDKNECGSELVCKPCSYDDYGYCENDDFSQDAVVCTICIMKIDDGERIGALPCNHMFHVDCLKEWIKRKNICPLCQKPNIAREKESENNSSTSQDSNGENNTANTNLEERRQVVRTTGAQVDPQDVTNNRRRRNRRISRNTQRGVQQRQLFHVNGERRGRVLVRSPTSNSGTIPRVSASTTTIQVTRRTNIQDLQRQRLASLNALRERYSNR